MPSVQIGRRRIDYRVRRSARAGRKRIEVTPAGVEVIVPEGTADQAVAAFVRSRRRWLHDKTQELAAQIERLNARTPEGLHSGAKVLFRGRYLKLRVETADRDAPSPEALPPDAARPDAASPDAARPHTPRLTYRTGFHVTVPPGLTDDEREDAVRGLLEQWMDERIAEDAWEVVRRRGRPHGLEPRGIRIKDQATLWGSCGRDRVLRLDRKLARLPRPVFDYVVVHELCHLKRRDHSPEFWALVKRVLPGYEEHKEWLEEHEVAVG